MGCGSSGIKQDPQKDIKKRIGKPTPIDTSVGMLQQQDQLNQNNLNESKKQDGLKREDNQDIKQEEKNVNDGISLTTPLNAQAAIKQIFIIPPYDSEGNLQEEIKTLEIKADVQSQLKKQKIIEAKKKQSQESEQSNIEKSPLQQIPEQSSQESLSKDIQLQQQSSDQVDKQKIQKKSQFEQSKQQETEIKQTMSDQKNSQSGPSQEQTVQSNTIETNSLKNQESNKIQQTKKTPESIPNKIEQTIRANNDENKESKADQTTSQINQVPTVQTSQHNGQKLTNQNKQSQQQISGVNQQINNQSQQQPQNQVVSSSETNGQQNQSGQNPFQKMLDINKQSQQQSLPNNQYKRSVVDQQSQSTPSRSKPIKGILEFMKQEDILKKIKTQEPQNPQNEYFSQYIEQYNYDKSDYFIEDDLIPSDKQDSLMDSQILMQIENDYSNQGIPVKFDFTRNLLSDFKKKQNSYQSNGSPSNSTWNNAKLMEKPIKQVNPVSNNVNLLKIIKKQQMNQSDQTQVKQQPQKVTQNKFESVYSSQFSKQQSEQQANQKEQEIQKMPQIPIQERRNTILQSLHLPKKQTAQESQKEEENASNIEENQIRKRESTKNEYKEQSKKLQVQEEQSKQIIAQTPNNQQEEKQNQVFQQPTNLLSIKSDDYMKIPTIQQKRLEKTKAQTISLTNSNPSQQNTPNSSNKQPPQPSQLGLIQNLNRLNTFDTVNDTISNASPINNSLLNNNGSKPENKEKKYTFNTEIQKINKLKKQETNMTEELEQIVKGMDDKHNILAHNNLRAQKTFDVPKTDEFALQKSPLSILKDLNLNKFQSEQNGANSAQNTSNLICDFERTENSRSSRNSSASRDEFQISISSPLKNSSRVLHTNSIQKEINKEGQKQINQYTLIKELGRGACGKVKLGLDEINQKYYAIKVSNKNKLKKKLVSQKINAFTLLEQEIAIMKKVDHPNIVKLHEVIDDSENNKLYLVMEYMKRGAILSSGYFKATIQSQDPIRYSELYDDNGKLKNRQNEPKSIDLNSALRYMRHMTLALDYMHNFAQICHRDIKPDNLLIDENDNLKVADFGISTLMEKSDETSSNAGTKAFMAPESWEKKVFKAPPLDIWATGVTLYIMIYGSVPFKEKKLIELKNEICQKEIVLPPIPEIPEQAKDLLFRMLDKNPMKRITAKGMLVHPWITGDGEFILKNVIDHTLTVENSDLEKAIRKTTKFTASVMIALGLKRVLKKARKSLMEQKSQNSLSISTPNNNQRKLSVQNKIENISKFSQKPGDKKEYKEPDRRYQKLNVSQLLRDESFNS
ncbi:Serine/Threonine kinase domain protein (macronuclear) [Tetrahymena thermophila SB210]|uniref:non-specific serine/threonine protein kinase n=1 Tax=Tetrahymena thermophila (strain SB210) TaxID=312017 RepID=I7LV96_TETTS|nr:Serine/Threonine kinase domain protein [Tetrahymena thermophila SB210]EAR97504.1 Serine/Threonine kinase domain protein [Tetrahymena thermophila SB210]|eukprot:XP_001017749.1 Serine/Threonine kinase domain protein [Tetrahymena thermophila SB210]